MLWYKERIRSIKIGKSGMGTGRKHQVGLRFEAEIAEMSGWMRARGVKESSVLSYSSRLREFATWYRGRKGGGGDRAGGDGEGPQGV